MTLERYVLFVKPLHVKNVMNAVYDGSPDHKEVDGHLKKTCELFINHVSSELVFPIKDFLSKVTATVYLRTDFIVVLFRLR